MTMNWYWITELQILHQIILFQIHSFIHFELSQTVRCKKSLQIDLNISVITPNPNCAHSLLANGERSFFRANIFRDPSEIDHEEFR